MTLTPKPAGVRIEREDYDELVAAVNVNESGLAAIPATYVPRVTYSSPLRKWYAGLANRGSAPVQAILFGDSITEGTGSTVLARRWQTVLQASLRARYATSGATYPFIPAYETASTDHPGITRSGTVTQVANSGFGGRTAIVGTDGVLTFTFTGTRAKILYSKASATGVMRLVVDGGAPILVDTNALTNPPAATPATWDSGALTDAAHTIVVTRDATSAAGQNPYVEGMLTYRGDESAGIRLIDSSRHGQTSAYLDATRTAAMARSLAAAGGAKLAVFAFGTNDYAIGPVAPADYRINIERQITALRANGFDGAILLLLVYMSSGRDSATWEAYGAQLAAMAAGDPDISYLNLRRSMPDIPTPYTDPAALGLFNDTLHPSDAGHGWIADVLTDHLSLRA